MTPRPSMSGDFPMRKTPATSLRAKGRDLYAAFISAASGPHRTFTRYHPSLRRHLREFAVLDLVFIAAIAGLWLAGALLVRLCERI